MKKISKKSKNLLQYIFLILLMTVTTYLVASTLDINILSDILKVIDYKYIAVGFLLMISYIILEGYILRVIINSIHGAKTKFLGYKVGILGLYYNLVTPMASGSQPMQVYELSKSNISASKAVAVVSNKTVIYQIMVTLYCIFLMAFNVDVLKSTLKPVLTFIAMGMSLNIVTLCFGFFVVYRPTQTKKFVHFIFNLLSKIKFLRFLGNKRSKVNSFIDEYNFSIKSFIKDKKALFKSTLLTIVQLTIYFSIAFCIYKALRLSGASYFYMLSLQVFLYMAVSAMPTPGNVGANELAFFTIFGGIFSKAIIGYSVFLYGIFVYYFVLIVCGLFTILSQGNVFRKIRLCLRFAKYKMNTATSK